MSVKFLAKEKILLIESQPQLVLKFFLNFCQFEPRRSYKVVLITKCEQWSAWVAGLRNYFPFSAWWGFHCEGTDFLAYITYWNGVRVSMRSQRLKLRGQNEKISLPEYYNHKRYFKTASFKQVYYFFYMFLVYFL